MSTKGRTSKPTKTYERPGTFFFKKHLTFLKEVNVGLSEEEIEEIREAFNLFDTDGSGFYNNYYRHTGANYNLE